MLESLLTQQTRLEIDIANERRHASKAGHKELEAFEAKNLNKPATGGQ